MPNYVYYCADCQAEEELTMTIKEMEEAIILCPSCNQPTQRLVQSPMVMRVGLPDGTRRKGFDKMKEAAKLEIERANAKPGSDNYKELGQAIRIIKSTKD